MSVYLQGFVNLNFRRRRVNQARSGKNGTTLQKTGNGAIIDREFLRVFPLTFL